MKNRPFQRVFGAFVAWSYFLTNALFLHAGEASLWKERRAAARRTSGVEASSSHDPNPLLAQLPATAQVPLGVAPRVSVGNGLFMTPGAASPGLLASAPGTPGWLSALVLPYGSLREIHLASAPGAPLIVHIQDAHGVEEAQRNMAAMIQGLRESRGVNLVGLEGAAGAFDLSPFRDWPDADAVRATADRFLKDGKIGGPELAGLTASQPPILWGLEEPALYAANVGALREAAAKKKTFTKGLGDLVAAAGALKESVYSPALKEFDRHSTAYQSGKEGLAAHVRYLAKVRGGAGGFPNLALLLKALSAEEALDFKAVERERGNLVERMAAKLPQAALDLLAQRSFEHRAGRMGYGAYHRFLQELCLRNGVVLDDLGEFHDYTAYVTLAEAVDRERLLDELVRMEDAALSLLAATPAQMTLAALGKRLSLLEKLGAHAMTPADWDAYEQDRANILSVARDLAALGGAAVPGLAAEDVAPFEDFCRHALARNRALVDNLAARMSAQGASSAVLVAGGFHTEGLTRLLRDRGFSYAVVTPKITEVPRASGYLDVFARDPLPLEKLFSGDKIFLRYPVLLAARHLPGFDGWELEKLKFILHAYLLTRRDPALLLENAREAGFTLDDLSDEGSLLSFRLDGRLVRLKVAGGTVTSLAPSALQRLKDGYGAWRSSWISPGLRLAGAWNKSPGLVLRAALVLGLVMVELAVSLAAKRPTGGLSLLVGMAFFRRASPGGEEARVQRIVQGIEATLQDDPAFLASVNFVRSEVYRQLGVPDAPLSREVLQDILHKVMVEMERNAHLPAWATDDEIHLAPEFTNALTDAELELVYGHEAGHLLLGFSLTEVERRVEEAQRDMNARREELPEYEKRAIRSRFNENDKHLFEAARFAQELGADEIGRLVHAAMGRRFPEKDLRSAFRKARVWEERKQSVRDVVRMLGWKTHPSDATRVQVVLNQVNALLREAATPFAPIVLVEAAKEVLPWKPVALDAPAQASPFREAGAPAAQASAKPVTPWRPFSAILPEGMDARRWIVDVMPAVETLFLAFLSPGAARLAALLGAASPAGIALAAAALCGVLFSALHVALLGRQGEEVTWKNAGAWFLGGAVFALPLTWAAAMLMTSALPWAAVALYLPAAGMSLIPHRAANAAIVDGRLKSIPLIGRPLAWLLERPFSSVSDEEPRDPLKEIIGPAFTPAEARVLHQEKIAARARWESLAHSLELLDDHSPISAGRDVFRNDMVYLSRGGMVGSYDVYFEFQQDFPLMPLGDESMPRQGVRVLPDQDMIWRAVDFDLFPPARVVVARAADLPGVRRTLKEQGLDHLPVLLRKDTTALPRAFYHGCTLSSFQSNLAFHAISSISEDRARRRVTEEVAAVARVPASAVHERKATVLLRDVGENETPIPPVWTESAAASTYGDLRRRFLARHPAMTDAVLADAMHTGIVVPVAGELLFRQKTAKDVMDSLSTLMNETTTEDIDFVYSSDFYERRRSGRKRTLDLLTTQELWGLLVHRVSQGRVWLAQFERLAGDPQGGVTFLSDLRRLSDDLAALSRWDHAQRFGIPADGTFTAYRGVSLPQEAAEYEDAVDFEGGAAYTHDVFWRHRRAFFTSDRAYARVQGDLLLLTVRVPVEAIRHTNHVTGYPEDEILVTGETVIQRMEPIREEEAPAGAPDSLNLLVEEGLGRVPAGKMFSFSPEARLARGHLPAVREFIIAREKKGDLNEWSLREKMEQSLSRNADDPLNAERLRYFQAKALEYVGKLARNPSSGSIRDRARQVVHALDAYVSRHPALPADQARVAMEAAHTILEHVQNVPSHVRRVAAATYFRILLASKPLPQDLEFLLGLLRAGDDVSEDACAGYIEALRARGSQPEEMQVFLEALSPRRILSGRALVAGLSRLRGLDAHGRRALALLTGHMAESAKDAEAVENFTRNLLAEMGLLTGDIPAQVGIPLIEALLPLRKLDGDNGMRSLSALAEVLDRTVDVPSPLVERVVRQLHVAASTRLETRTWPAVSQAIATGLARAPGFSALEAEKHANFLRQLLNGNSPARVRIAAWRGVTRTLARHPERAEFFLSGAAALWRRAAKEYRADLIEAVTDGLRESGPLPGAVHGLLLAAAREGLLMDGVVSRRALGGLWARLAASAPPGTEMSLDPVLEGAAVWPSQYRAAFIEGMVEEMVLLGRIPPPLEGRAAGLGRLWPHTSPMPETLAKGWTTLGRYSPEWLDVLAAHLAQLPRRADAGPMLAGIHRAMPALGASWKGGGALLAALALRGAVVPREEGRLLEALKTGLEGHPRLSDAEAAAVSEFLAQALENPPVFETRALVAAMTRAILLTPVPPSNGPLVERIRAFLNDSSRAHAAARGLAEALTGIRAHPQAAVRLLMLAAQAIPAEDALFSWGDQDPTEPLLHAIILLSPQATATPAPSAPRATLVPVDIQASGEDGSGGKPFMLGGFIQRLPLPMWAKAWIAAPLLENAFLAAPAVAIINAFARRPAASADDFGAWYLFAAGWVLFASALLLLNHLKVSVRVGGKPPDSVPPSWKVYFSERDKEWFALRPASGGELAGMSARFVGIGALVLAGQFFVRVFVRLDPLPAANWVGRVVRLVFPDGAAQAQLLTFDLFTGLQTFFQGFFYDDGMKWMWPAITVAGALLGLLWHGGENVWRWFGGKALLVGGILPPAIPSPGKRWEKAGDVDALKDLVGPAERVDWDALPPSPALDAGLAVWGYRQDIAEAPGTFHYVDADALLEAKGADVRAAAEALLKALSAEIAAGSLLPTQVFVRGRPETRRLVKALAPGLADRWAGMDLEGGDMRVAAEAAAARAAGADALQVHTARDWEPPEDLKAFVVLRKFDLSALLQRALDALRHVLAQA